MVAETFLWRIAVRAPNAHYPKFEDVLEPYCMTLSFFKIGNTDTHTEWMVEGFALAEPDKEMIRHKIDILVQDLGIEPVRPVFELVPPKNWLAENFNDFPPVEVGRFFIHGSHNEEDIPPGRHVLKLDSGTAFGSGEHASTSGCLLAIESLAKHLTPRRCLDMGCGSGILALAMARVWKATAPIIASDIDAESTRVTRINTKNNYLPSRILACCAPGYGAPIIKSRGPYDLIISNILANPLRVMAKSLSQNLTPASEGGGYAVLSGFLIRDAKKVLHAHQTMGFRLVKAIDINGWRTLIVAR